MMDLTTYNLNFNWLRTSSLETQTQALSEAGRLISSRLAREMDRSGNDTRIQKWRESKTQEWKAGGKLKTRFPIEKDFERCVRRRREPNALSCC